MRGGGNVVQGEVDGKRDTLGERAEVGAEAAVDIAGLEEEEGGKEGELVELALALWSKVEGVWEGDRGEG